MLFHMPAGAIWFLDVAHQSLGGDVLELGLDLEIGPGQMAQHQVVDRLVPHEVRMGAQILRLDPCRHQHLEVRKRRDVLIRQEILPGDADMAHGRTAPGSDDASDPWIVGLDVFALAHNPVMVKVENERHLVGKGQKVVETEADLVSSRP